MNVRVTKTYELYQKDGTLPTLHKEFQNKLCDFVSLNDFHYYLTLEFGSRDWDDNKDGTFCNLKTDKNGLRRVEWIYIGYQEYLDLNKGK
jgi:hypothetical protein